MYSRYYALNNSCFHSDSYYMPPRASIADDTAEVRVKCLLFVIGLLSKINISKLLKNSLGITNSDIVLFFISEKLLLIQ